MINPFLIGKLIYLRPLEESDIDRCLRWINDPDIRSTLSRYSPLNRLREQEWIASQYKDDHNIPFAVAIKESDAHIGTCGLHAIDYKDRCAELGILLGEKEEWGRGYGSETMQLLINYGFRELGLHRIFLRVFSHNERAKRIYKQVGFRCEGVLRESYFHAGRFHDTIIMSILSREWKQRPSTGS